MPSPTSDGGYLLAGYSESNASGDKSENSKGFADYWIIKIDAQGKKQWDKTIGSEGYDVAPELITTTDGNYLLAGTSSSIAVGDKSEPSKGGEDFWVLKIDIHGKIIWDKTVGGGNTDFLMGVTKASDSGFVLGGFSDSPASGDKSEGNKGNNVYKEFDYWAVKIGETKEKSSITHFTWVNADGDNDFGYLYEGELVILLDLGDVRVSFRANTFPVLVDSVKLVLRGPITTQRMEKTPPYALFGDNPPQDYAGKFLIPGSYTITATPYLQGQKGTPLTNSFSVISGPAVKEFTLINADNDQDIGTLNNGNVIDQDALGNPNLTIRANIFPNQIERVKMELSGPITLTREERYEPYSLFGYSFINRYEGQKFIPGNYKLKATPMQGDREGIAKTINFTVTGQATTQASSVEVFPVPSTGKINIQYTGEPGGTSLTLLDFSNNVVFTRAMNNSSDGQLDLSFLKKGIYYLRLVNMDGVQVKRIVIE